MAKLREMQARYITDETGKKTDVVLPIEEFEELLQDLSDIAALLERRNEATIPFEQVIAKLKSDGLLSD